MCPICKGKKTRKKGHYSNGTKIPYPCHFCNGVGSVTKHKAKKGGYHV